MEACVGSIPQPPLRPPQTQLYWWRPFRRLFKTCKLPTNTPTLLSLNWTAGGQHSPALLLGEGEPRPQTPDPGPGSPLYLNQLTRKW